MQYSASSFNTGINSSKSFTNKHKTVIEDLEVMLEKGIPRSNNVRNSFKIKNIS